MSQMIRVAISDLHPSRSNVRELYDPAADKRLPELIASIKSIGVIQPLAVAKRKKGGGYEVIAGQRRAAALKQIVEADPNFPADVDVVEITDKAILSEASLAENYARAAMTLPQVYTAFGRIRAERPNASVEELGAMFGFDTARTRRILRLANLSHNVMEAYRRGDIDDAAAQAFAATEDQTLQDRVFEQLADLSQYQRGPVAIRRLLGLMDTDERDRLTFVGVDAYTAAGGGFEADFFNADEGRLLDPDILTKLFDDKVEESKDRFLLGLQRGKKAFDPTSKTAMADLQFSWGAQPPQITQYGYASDDRELRIDNPKLAPMDEETKARADALDAQAEELNGILEAEKVDDDDPRFADLEKIDAERNAIEDARAIMLPRKGAVIGIVKVSRGEFIVDLWYASRKDKGIDEPSSGRSKAAVGAEQSDGEKIRRRLGITKDGAHALFLVKRDMIRENLYISATRGSSLALDFLLFSQARAIVRVVETPAYYAGGPVYRQYSGSEVGIENPASQDDGGTKPPKKVRDVFERLTAGQTYRAALASMALKEWAAEPDPIKGWALFKTGDQATKDRAAAIVACHGMKASDSFYQDGETPRMMEELANYLTPEEGCAEWRETLVMDTAFFELFNHKRRMEMLASWGAGDHPDGKKAATSAAFCAKVVNADEEGQAQLGIAREDGMANELWLPEILETDMVQPLPVEAKE